MTGNNFKPQLIGKNAIEAARILAEEFIKLFGEEWGTVAEVVKQLLPRGKACSWGMLDRHINLFCKQFYENWETEQDKVAFFDEARFALESLPMKQDYKLPSEKEEYSSIQSATEHFTTCYLCWRSVLRKPLEKKTPLCHLHDIPSTSPEYRRRMRMKKRAEALKLALLKSLPALPLVKQSEGAELHEYVKSLCLNESSPLAHLVHYLRSLNMPLYTGEEILRALEYPIYYDNLSPFIGEVWDYHLQDLGKHFKLNYIKLLAAEAWLRAESSCKHGGKRR